MRSEGQRLTAHLKPTIADEIRHRTTQRFTYPCMHKTGIKRAMHSGLSIDDGNAIYKLMDDRKLVKESRLDSWFIKIDGLDYGDDIGPLDKRSRMKASGELP
ncbi:unnamed protein product [Peronospora destructor]|uniref:Uncharacterized protein n=1 Tax=Peronospora destructor TaxID=86335 RepID=A0AAV0UJS6_9STRA|nr:unnamed protein product [Peronospora destructor]